MKKEYDNYIFDLYGTLVDIRTDEESPLFWERFCHYCRFLGMDCRADTLRETYLRLCREAEEAMGGGQAEIDLAAVWPRLGAAFGIDPTRDDTDAALAAHGAASSAAAASMATGRSPRARM